LINSLICINSDKIGHTVFSVFILKDIFWINKIVCCLNCFSNTSIYNEFVRVSALCSVSVSALNLKSSLNAHVSRIEIPSSFLYSNCWTIELSKFSNFCLLIVESNEMFLSTFIKLMAEGEWKSNNVSIKS